MSAEAELKEGDQQNYYWRVFSPRAIISEKIELHLCHPTAGVIQVIENEGKRVFYNQEKNGHVVESKLPHIKGIKYVSGLSPNNKYIAYFTAEPLFKDNPSDMVPQNKKKKGEKEPPRTPYAFAYRVIIAPAITSDSLEAAKFKMVELPFVKENVHINLDQQPIDIKWCGNRAVVLHFQNQELYLCSTQGELVKIEKERGEKEKWSLLKEEVDGCRVLSKKENKILRELPMAFKNVFESFS